MTQTYSTFRLNVLYYSTFHSHWEKNHLPQQASGTLKSPAQISRLTFDLLAELMTPCLIPTLSFTGFP